MENNISLTITISQEEKDALIILAKRQRRDLDDQAAMLIRHGLMEYGLIIWRPDHYELIDETLLGKNCDGS